ncbi:MAG: SGNH/GDSL hydrolase family protein [Chitinophagales bacterium]
MKHHLYTLLCLGDSYTIGEAVSESERFPTQAVALLKNERIDFEEPLIIAKTGWTTDELSFAIAQENLTKQFDFVTLLIGVNNQYRGRDTANYRQEFRNLLNTALRYTNGQSSRVFVFSIPDWGVTPFAKSDKRGEKKIGEEIDMYNAINSDEAHKAGVHYIDITPVSRMAKTDISLIAIDGLHPSGNMYKLWAKLLVEKMYPYLRIKH